MEPRLENRWSK